MWLTIHEVSDYIKISKETIYKMVKQSKLPATKIGNQWRFNKSLVDDWLLSSANFKQSDLQPNSDLENHGNIKICKI